MSVAPESVWIFKGMGAHCLQLQLEVGIPVVGKEAWQLLFLETILYVPRSNSRRAPLATANVSIPFKPAGQTRRETLYTSSRTLERSTADTGMDTRNEQVVGSIPTGGSRAEVLTNQDQFWREKLYGAQPPSLGFFGLAVRLIGNVAEPGDKRAMM